MVLGFLTPGVAYWRGQIGTWHEAWVSGAWGIATGWVAIFISYGFCFWASPYRLLKAERNRIPSLEKATEESKRHVAKVAEESKKHIAMWGLKYKFAALGILGYRLVPSEVDAWNDSCKKFIAELFGADSYEVRVFNRTATDSAVEQKVMEQKIRMEMIRGGRHRHPNDVRNEDSPIVHAICVLEWAEARFVASNPLT